MITEHLRSIHESAESIDRLDFTRDRPDLSALDIYLEADDKGFKPLPYTVRDADPSERKLLQIDRDGFGPAESAYAGVLAREDDGSSDDRSSISEVTRLIEAAKLLNEVCDSPHINERITALEEAKDGTQELLDVQLRKLAKLDSATAALCAAEEALVEEQAQLMRDIEEEQQEILFLQSRLKAKNEDVEDLRHDIGERLPDSVVVVAAAEDASGEEDNNNDDYVRALMAEIEHLESNLQEASQALESSEIEFEQLTARNRESDFGNEAVDEDAMEHPNALYTDVVRQYRDLIGAFQENGSEDDGFSISTSDVTKSRIVQALNSMVTELDGIAEIEDSTRLNRSVDEKFIRALAEEDASGGEADAASVSTAKALARVLVEESVPIPEMKRMLSAGATAGGDGTTELYALVASDLISMDRMEGKDGTVRLKE